MLLADSRGNSAADSVLGWIYAALGERITWTLRSRWSRGRAAGKEPAEDDNGIGDLDSSGIVRVRGIGADRGRAAAEKKEQRYDAIGKVHAAIGVGIPSHKALPRRSLAGSLI